MRICIDLDGVIANLKREGESYSQVLPVDGTLEAIRRLGKDGHHLIIHTARHMRSCGGDVGRVIARQGWTTLEWLRRHSIEVDEINFGKPYADLYIDDNALRFTSWAETLDEVTRLKLPDK